MPALRVQIPQVPDFDSAELSSPAAGSPKKKGRQTLLFGDEKLVDVSLAETIWEVPLLLGLPELSHSSSFLLVVSVILNAALQLVFCYAVYTEDEFTGDPFAEMLPYMQRWRLSTGRD